MLFVMLAAVGVDFNDDLATLQAFKPPNIAPNVLRSVMKPPPIPDVPPLASKFTIQLTPLTKTRVIP